MTMGTVPQLTVRNKAASVLKAREKGMVKLEIDLIFKIAAIGIIVAVLNQVLTRAGRDDQAMMTALVGLIVVLMMVIEQISVLFDTVKSLFEL